MKSCTVCTCTVFPQSERGSASSSVQSCQMICCIVCSCISSPHRGSSCDWKGSSCLRMYSDTSHKIFVLTSSIIASSSACWSLLTVMNWSKGKLSLSLQTHPVCSPRHDGWFCTFGLIFRLFVLEYVKNRMSYLNSGVTCFCDTWQCFENERASELARYMQILPDGSSRPPGTSTHRHNSVSQPKLTSQHITMTMSTLQY